MELRPPAQIEADSPPEAVTEPTPGRPDAPLLLAGSRDGSRASMVLVGEVRGGALRRFPDPAFPTDAERLERAVAPGAAWTLFSEGVRVGRLVVDSRESAGEVCAQPPRVGGRIELVPEAAGADRFLALTEADAQSVAYEPYERYTHDYDQRVFTLQMANEAIPESGAAWPPLGVLEARDDIQAFRTPGARGPAVAATFVHQDGIAVGAPEPGAYALFVIGEPSTGGYARTFTWYREAEADGKGAPRYFDHFDFDGDGSDEILLEVFGARQRWYALLRREADAWSRVYEDPCGRDPATSR